MSKTSNNFNDIMRMPYCCYLAIVKNLRLQDLMQIPEWRNKYLEWKYKVELKENRIDKSKYITKCDVDALHMLAGSL